MYAREMSIYIEAPPETVFAYVSDVLRHPELSSVLMEMSHQSGPERGPGATYASLSASWAAPSGGGCRWWPKSRPAASSTSARTTVGATAGP